MADVIVIGAGLSGLRCAELVLAGIVSGQTREL